MSTPEPQSFVGLYREQPLGMIPDLRPLKLFEGQYDHQEVRLVLDIDPALVGRRPGPSIILDGGSVIGHILHLFVGDDDDLPRHMTIDLGELVHNVLHASEPERDQFCPHILEGGRGHG